MQPWVAYGQVTVPFNTSVTNPTCNRAGVRGEVSLPYVVPEGFELILEAFGIEAYGITGLVGMFPWLGELPAANAKALHTCMANTESHESVGARYHLPAGTKLNATIMCTENPAQVVGFYLSGTLVPTGAPA